MYQLTRSASRMQKRHNLPERQRPRSRDQPHPGFPAQLEQLVRRLHSEQQLEVSVQSVAAHSNCSQGHARLTTGRAAALPCSERNAPDGR